MEASRAHVCHICIAPSQAAGALKQGCAPLRRLPGLPLPGRRNGLGHGHPPHLQDPRGVPRPHDDDLQCGKQLVLIRAPARTCFQCTRLPMSQLQTACLCGWQMQSSGPRSSSYLQLSEPQALGAG